MNPREVIRTKNLKEIGNLKEITKLIRLHTYSLDLKS